MSTQEEHGTRTHAVAYRVEPSNYSDLPPSTRDQHCLFVVDGGTDHGWSIRLGAVQSPTTMNRDGEFRFDDRSDLRRWRYPLQQAISIAERHVDNLPSLRRI